MCYIASLEWQFDSRRPTIYLLKTIFSSSGGTLDGFVNLALLETIRAKSGRYHVDYFVSLLVFAIDNIKETPYELTLKELAVIVDSSLKLKIPLASIKLIAKRAKKQGFLTQQDGKYILRKDEIRKEADKLKARRHEIELAQNEFFADFVTFIKQKYSQEITPDQAEIVFQDYFSRYHEQVTGLTLAHDQTDSIGLRNEDFLVSDYIKHVYSNKKSIFDSLEKIVKGYLLANYVCIRGTDTYREDLKKIEIYLDTPIILALLGFTGQLREVTVLELLELIFNLGAKVNVFDHTVSEAQGVIRAWSNDLRNRNFRDFVPGTLALIRAKGLDSVALESLAAVLPNRLRDHRIKISERPHFNEKYAISELELESALEVKGEYEGERVKHDALSVIAVYQLRSGRAKMRFNERPTLFVTTNRQFVEKTNRFFAGSEIEEGTGVVVTDAWLTNLCWIISPEMFPGLPKRLIVSNCYSTIYGNTKFWQDFLRRLRRLRDDKKITKDDYALVRYEHDLKQCLEEVAVTKGSDYSDDTVFEILESTKSKILKNKDLEIASLQSGVDKRDLAVETVVRFLGFICGLTTQAAIVLAGLGIFYFLWRYPDQEISLAVSCVLGIGGLFGWPWFTHTRIKVQNFVFNRLMKAYSKLVILNS